MPDSTILVVDGDPKNLQILRETLELAEFRVTTADNGIDAWGIIQSQKPDMIVCEIDIRGLDGFELHQRLQKSSATAAIPVVFLTNRRDLDDRLRSLRSGVKDYMIKPLHVKEVVARLQMILRRISQIAGEESQSGATAIGSLEESSVEDLIETYGLERKTGALAIYDENNHSGEIFFRDGSVINAHLDHFRAEKAVYQMLPWRRGRFVMTFKEVSVEEEITVSNLGLLLQGYKRLKDRAELEKRLPSLQSVFVRTDIFEQVLEKKSVSGDAKKFISLFDGNKMVSHIISESVYDDLKTLEKTVKLYEQGFIRPVELNNKSTKQTESGAMPESESFEHGDVPRLDLKLDFDAEEDTTVSSEEIDFPGEKGLESDLRREAVEMHLPQEAAGSDPDAIEPDDQSYDLIEPSLPPESESFEHDRLSGVDFGSHIEKEEWPPGSSAEFDLAGEEEMESEPRDESLAPPEPVEEEPAPDLIEHELREPDLLAKTGDEPLVPAATNQVDRYALGETCDLFFKGASQTSAHLAVICSDNDTRRELLSTITSGHSRSTSLGTQHEHLAEIGSVVTRQQNTLKVLGLAFDKTLLHVLDRVSGSLLACVVLMQTGKSQELGYQAYLVNSLRNKFAIPHLLAIPASAGRDQENLKTIRQAFSLRTTEPLIEVDIQNVESVRSLLERFQPADA